MTRLDSLTGGRQFMNMAKVGMVPCPFKISALFGNPHKQRACELMRYTLCVFKPVPTRYSLGCLASWAPQKWPTQ